MDIRKIPAAVSAQVEAILAAMPDHHRAFVAPEAVVAVLMAQQQTRPDPIASVVKFNVDAGNTADVLNVRQSALYTALQCEELAEKLAAVGMAAWSTVVDNYGKALREGAFDDRVEAALRDSIRREEMLDSDVDLIVVSIGAAISQGADIAGALAEVCRANDAKRNFEGRLVRDASGKIQKPEGWKAPDLRPFMGREFPMPF